MSTQETTDLRAMPGLALRRELDDSQRALFNLRFQAATRQLADVSQVRGARRRVARIKTLLREREILVELGELTEDETPVAVAESPVEELAGEPEDAVDVEADANAPEDAAGDEPDAGGDEPDAGDDEPDAGDEDDTEGGEDDAGGGEDDEASNQDGDRGDDAGGERE